MFDFSALEGRFWRELKAGATEAEALAHSKVADAIEASAKVILPLVPDGAAVEALLLHLDHAADEAHALVSGDVTPVADPPAAAEAPVTAPAEAPVAEAPIAATEAAAAPPADPAAPPYLPPTETPGA